MSSLIWYIYEFARKAWICGFFNAKSKKEITHKPDRFRDFPNVIKKNCIGCGSCTISCPSPNAIKLIRNSDNEESIGLTYPVINKSSCIRCGFCAEVCPSTPKTLECGENHFIHEEFNIIPSKRKYIIDDYLCIRCKKCINACEINAIEEVDERLLVNQSKCIACGKCLDTCPVKGAIRGLFINNIEEQKKIINLAVSTLEEYIESKQDDLIKLDTDKLFLDELKFHPIFNKSLTILNDEEIAHEILEDSINRLKIRIITWNENNCKKCQMCIPDCPTKAISFNNNKNTIVRDNEKCLRCSICYQTCPFHVIKYFLAKFNLDTNDNDEKVIHISIKASQLTERRL